MARRTASPANLGEELIDDGAVRSGDQDRLGHSAVAAELADLAMAVPTPSNIALFGPWGSGKTGIGNLLQENLKHRPNTPKFVRYDAYKYAETPLRRHFLEAVAGQLGTKAKKVVRDSYENTTTNKLKLPPRDFGIAALAFSIALAGYVVMTLLLTWISGTSLKEAAGQVRGALPGGVALSAILAIVFSAFGKSLTVQVTRTSPTTDDEFEGLFVKLVSAVSEKRLVVFIDELDRCSPNEVTATLDAVRTFLGVSKCVFIVSADQQVLERALSSGLRQHTPIDTSNPYYTSGSAVLDKLFAQQVHVPPPLPRRLTQYAKGLVADRPGLWTTVDLDRVVSILIPSHVSSPRRIKTLLNNFAVQFRLASRRAEDGSIEGPIAARAQELAKLVCLRTEFPLFAAHLADDPELVQLVVNIHLAAESAGVLEKPPLVHRASWTIAADFASGHAPVDVLLDTAEAQSAPEERPSAEEAEMETPSPAAMAQRSQSEQFLEYLVRTQAVPGPSADLIHLEDAGTVYGLPNEVARRLESAAVNGDVVQVLRLVEEMRAAEVAKSDETSDGLGRAIRVLVDIAQHAAIGIEGDNVAKVLLATVGTAASIDPHEADLTMDCLRGLGFPEISDETSCRYVLRLVASTSAEYPTVASRALEYLTELAEGSGDLDAELVRVGDVASIRTAPEAPAAMASVLRRSAEARAALSDLDGRRQTTIIELARPKLLDWAEKDAQSGDPAAAAALTPAATAGTATALPAAPPPDRTEVALVDLLSRFGDDLVIGEIVIELALAADRKGLRDVVFELVGGGRSISTTQTAATVVKSLRRRYISIWGPVLRSLKTELTTGDAGDPAELMKELRQSTLHVADQVGDLTEQPANWADALKELERLTRSLGPGIASVVDDRAATRIGKLDPSDLGQLQAATQEVQLLKAAGMLSGTAAVDGLLGRVGASLPLLTGPTATDAAWKEWLFAATRDELLTSGSEAAVKELFDAIPTDGGAGTNVPVAAIHDLAVRCAAELRQRDSGARLLAPAVVASWFTELPSEYPDVSRARAIILADSASELWALLVSAASPPGPQTLPAMTVWLGNHPDEADDLARIAIEGAVANDVDLNLASAAVSPQVTGDTLSAELIRMFESSDEYAARLRVLRLWQALGISGDKSITLLVRRVFIPFVGSGADAAREGSRSVRVLLGASKTAQREAIDVLRQATPAADAESLERALVETGLRKRQRRILGIPIGSADDDSD